MKRDKVSLLANRYYLDDNCLQRPSEMTEVAIDETRLGNIAGKVAVVTGKAVSISDHGFRTSA